MLEIRNGNEALEFLLREWQLLDDKTKFLVESLPLFGHVLYSLSEKEAYHFISLFGQESDSELMQEITNSIFDVVLTVYFSEAFAFSNNKEVSSALVDALLFQSIGSEATPVISEEEFLGTTQNCRGIYKFYLGRQRFKI